jgi:pimeloyl-ACP methyl ester carboxylesterase
MTGEESTGSTDIDGRRFAWRSLGSGPPLVLLNGYSTSAEDWDPTLLATLSSAFTVTCPDNRGMGESELGDPDALTIDGMAADVERLLDALDVERALVGGWSMGGFVTQQLATRAPGRVEAMVLIGTDPGGPAAVRATPADWSQLTDLSGTPRERATRLIPLLFPAAFVPAIDAAFGDQMGEALARLSPTAIAAQTRAMAAWHAEDRPAVDASTAPRALVLHGSEDVVIPPENAETLAARWPTCEVEVFVGGHAFFALDPTTVAKAMTSFGRG